MAQYRPRRDGGGATLGGCRREDRGFGGLPAARLVHWQRWSKLDRAVPELDAKATYGLPALHREAIRKARIGGNPRCYATAVQLESCRSSKPTLWIGSPDSPTRSRA
jgi:hypothetical protein